ncbi:MAG: cytochrome c maturation protein CcmE [Gammaproteobacteria bacterium]|nr:cytochrome c maturation protein CcmE [Gammaproteobacteria bacterium]
MRPHRKKRLAIIAFIALSMSAAAGLTMFALSQNINMFYSPTQIANGEVANDLHFRIGGMVKAGSVEKSQDSLKVNFVTTDFVNDVPIQYEGILPDLFREGQGVVAEGALSAQGIFVATKVLAKHDENYMSPEVKAAMEAAGASPQNHSGLSEQ